MAYGRTVLAATAVIGATLIFGTAAIIGSLLDRSGRLVDACTRAWARLLGGAAGMRVTAVGAERIDRAQSYVIVANHQSHLDSVALFNTCPVPVRMLAKAYLFRIPLFGQAIRRAGHIEVRPGARRDFNELLAQVEAMRRRGQSLVVYAEGVRSLDGRLGPFKTGAFRIAHHFNLPILPVTIRGTFAILPTKRIRFTAGDAEVIYHEPIAPAEDPETLLRRTREIIAAPLCE